MPKINTFKDLEKLRKLQWEESTLTETYGKLTAEPFNRGIGRTIGNSLRRMLLSSIKGSAVTSVKIKGVLHEFSTIPGVVEDVADIILNLKRLVPKLTSSGAKMIHLKSNGAGEVRASDIVTGPDVEILNKDLLIATLGEDGAIEMDIEVGTGYGYVPASENKREDQPIGVIPVDSLFSPVVRVNYNIEDVRVGGVTDYERLILEVWTNGTITPQDAVAHAAENLKDHLKLFTHFKEPVEVEEREEEKDKELEKLKEVLRISVDELELSVRSSNCLRAANITTLGELALKTEQEMLKTRNFGKKSLHEIKEKLGMYNLTLGMKGISHLVEEIKGETSKGI
ncbi:MAG: DNA-directed RNA polymerase subunit alpha [bacterium]|nr:DNA-directed RNA polymerase subunit alpha [bacterium]